VGDRLRVRAKDGLNIELITNAIKIIGVEGFGREYGKKWGRIYVMVKHDIPVALSALRKSLNDINFCIANNITTGWHSEPED
jgi:hypothetical protein